MTQTPVAPIGPMSVYAFLDGPLAGQVLESRDIHGAGDHIEVSVVDVYASADDVADHRYAVHTPASGHQPGDLRYVGPRPVTEDASAA